MHSQESGPRPRGSKLDPVPPSFFPWRLQWGLSVFQWGSNPHNPPPIFTLSVLLKLTTVQTDTKHRAACLRQQSYLSYYLPKLI